MRRIPLLSRTLLICALLVAAYYLAPVEPDAAGLRLVVRAVAAGCGVAVVAVLIVRLAVRLASDEPSGRAGLVGLAVALFSGLIVFAFVDYLVAVSRPGEFAGLATKTDGLYFAVTTLATVGYGDVYAAGQLARILVTVQQLFNFALIATGATVLGRRLTGLTQRRT